MPNAPIDRLLDIMTRLRGEGGCPWDREQSLTSLKQYLVEECYEVLDAIDAGDARKHEEELGDLLLQVVFQAQIRKEAGSFDFNGVVERICEKLVRRHPHVFGDRQVSGSGEVLKNWDRIKAQEKADQAAPGRPVEPRSAVEGVPRHLPALQKAHQIQKRVARVGFDWSRVHDVVAKIEEELAEVKQALAGGDRDRVRAEVGDLLFAVVNLGRFQDINAEEALNETIARFCRRFQEVERRLRERGRELSQCTLAEMECEWVEVKKCET